MFIQVSCSSEASAPHEIIEARMDTTVELSFGQTAVLDQGPLEVMFFDVGSDSRCPEDVTCVWAGDVEIQLMVTENNKELSWVLHSHPDFSNQYSTGEYTIKLSKVEPSPKSYQKISKEEYRISLIISKNDGGDWT